MKIIRNKLSNLMLTPGYGAVTIWPFVFVRTDQKVTERLLNHERIHCLQQLEMLWLPFFLWYAAEWLIRAVRDPKTAYDRIAFEREAYTYEREEDYFMRRKPFGWVKYLNK